VGGGHPAAPVAIVYLTAARTAFISGDRCFESDGALRTLTTPIELYRTVIARKVSY